MKIEIINQIFETQEDFGFTINQFKIDDQFSLEELLDKYILDVEIRPNFAKKGIKINTGEHGGYLKGLFKSDKLLANDFNFISADSIYYYLEGFSDSEEEWGEDKSKFKDLLEKFKIFSSIDDCHFINKEWFDIESEKVRSREFTLYDFYFIIIWVDKNDKFKLYVSEWFSD